MEQLVGIIAIGRDVFKNAFFQQNIIIQRIYPSFSQVEITVVCSTANIFFFDFGVSTSTACGFSSSVDSSFFLSDFGFSTWTGGGVGGGFFDSSSDFFFSGSSLSSIESRLKTILLKIFFSKKLFFRGYKT